MAGSLLAVGMVFYVVQATANDGDLLDLDNIQLSQSSEMCIRDRSYLSSCKAKNSRKDG